MYDPQQAGLAALFARLDSKDGKTPAPETPAVKKENPEPASDQHKFHD